MIGVILIIATLLRIVGSNQSFWLDETAQAIISKQLFTIDFGADFQPPLFYFLTYIWQLFGITHEWFLRIPTILFGLASIYLTYMLIQKESSGRALLTAFLLSISSYHIYFSHEYRMYGFFMFLTVLSWLLLKRGRWVFYCLTLAALLYTHYFAFLVWIPQGIYVLMQKGAFKKWCFAAFAAGLTFLPWIPTLIRQIQMSNALQDVIPHWRYISGVGTIKFIPLLTGKLTVGMISPENRIAYGITTAIVGVMFLGGLAFSWKKSLMMTLWLGVPLVFGVLIAGVSPVNSPHRFVFIAPAFYYFVATGILEVERRYTVLQRIPTVLICLILSFWSFQYLSNEKYQREDWKRAVKYSDEMIRSGGEGIVSLHHHLPSLDWYSNYPEKYHPASTILPFREMAVAKTVRDIDKKNPSKIIYFPYLYDLTDPERLVEKELVKKYKLVSEKDFRGVGIIRIYKQ